MEEESLKIKEKMDDITRMASNIIKIFVEIVNIEKFIFVTFITRLVY